jgi:hypothetical protein
MTKISRPFQIALVAVVLLAAVYFVALRKHSSSSESSAPVASTATPSSASSASSAGTSASSSSAASPSAGGTSGGTSTYKGSAPGVDGLTRAIQKARGAVSESEQHAKALQQKATAASGTAENLGSSATGTAGSGSAAASGGTAAATHAAATTHAASSAAAAVKAKSKTPASKTGATKTASGVPVMQARVERELKHGDVAALLFWNPSGAVDNTVRRELQATARKLHGKLAISIARSSEVGSFGTFTRTVQVYGTPTILLINPAGKTASVTGLTDVFSLEQAFREIKHSK